MANTSVLNGFQLCRVTKEVTRKVFQVDSSNGVAIAIGDAITIEADGNVTRVQDGSVSVDGIVESFVVKAKSGQGPESLDYLPASTAAELICITDTTCEFETQIATVAQLDFDTGAKVDVVDAAPDATLRKSNQSVTLTSGSQLYLTGLSERIGNALGASAKVYVKLIAATGN